MNDTNIKGLNVKKLSTKLIIVELVLFLVSVFMSIRVYESHESVDNITDEYSQIQSEIYVIQTHSDYQSAKARQYVRTGESTFAQEYLEEGKYCEADKVDIADYYSIGKSAIEHIGDSRIKSAILHKSEKRAMSLVAYDSLDKEINPEMFGYELTKEEKSLSAKERLELADSIVFGEEYNKEKNSFRESIESATEDLLGSIASYKEEKSKIYRVAFVVLIVLLVISLDIFMVIAYCLFKYVLRPLDESIKAIQEDKKIPFSNSYELNYLANTYNKVFEENVNTRLHLKSKAERDALTGLLNRDSFDNLVNFYKDSKESIAFLIIDVDNFKDVNDNYGHQIGDKALKRVATILKQTFRSDDFIIRYGGDEFTVIMTELNPESQRGIIERKLAYINETLQNPNEEGMPKLSVSVGVAFSTNGFEDGLFKKADGALYKSKEKGRCGFTFAK